MLWVGVDIGGTFTDIVVYDEVTRQICTVKTPSLHENLTRGILTGLQKADTPLPSVSRLVHGTTIATNTVLEGKGARTAVVTTKGFRDVLELGYGNRVVLYNLTYRKPPPLVARPLRLEVNERTLADGRVKKTVSRPEIGRLAARFAEEGVEAVAVCFLHSYGNRKNEERARALLEDFLPEVFVTASAEVVPEFREYERFSTTVLNAYVARSVSRYLERLQQELTKGGGNAVLHVMTSSGGVMSTEVAARLPAHLLLSGPAGGVTAAGHLALSTGERQLIAYDMGGTSTDVSLVLGGTPSMTTEGEVLGYPNKVLQMEIETIGAGGGGALPGWIEAASSPWDPRAQGPTPVRPAMDVEASNPQ